MRKLGSWSLSGTGHAAAAGFAAFFLLGNMAFWLRPATSAVQPIAFNHAKHIANGLNCTDCHAGAQDQARATLPPLATCLTCHESALTQSPEEAKIRTLAASGQPLRWTRLTRVPPHVYFSHRRHVQLAGLKCEGCHGPVQQATTPPGRAFRAFTMAVCINCHEQRGFKTDCNDCHR